MSPATRSTALLTLLLLALSPWPGTSAASPSHALTTHAERTGFTQTGRYAEVVAMCEAFARAYPETVRCFDFGTSPEGRPMKALAISQAGALEPTQSRSRKLPVVLVQGGIHPGEADGKDAGFLALRQVLEGDAAAGALDRLVWLFVPVFNVDGHERFEP
ncbi:MAG: peptidase M14, partial [Gammaproteobacteria bacterium]|nr:peptidase M14 [Gammaproteobacteria bacterium]